MIDIMVGVGVVGVWLVGKAVWVMIDEVNKDHDRQERRFMNREEYRTRKAMERRWDANLRRRRHEHNVKISQEQKRKGTILETLGKEL